ncbi:MAG TPA: hypothetical protein VNJ71_12175 [Gemmatimonadales bacterium]|jgi:hypothetical protein|nr:hypothetical protein [Gemmatimonadales bacterium]
MEAPANQQGRAAEISSTLGSAVAEIHEPAGGLWHLWRRKWVTERKGYR